MRLRLLIQAAAVSLLAVTSLPAQSLTIYDEVLQNGFANYSYGGTAADFDFASTAQAHAGTKSIRFTGNSFNAVSLAHATTDFTTAQYPTIHFWAHGGSTGLQQLRVYLQLNGAIVASGELDGYITGGSLAAGAWREVTIAITAGALGYSGSFDRIDLQSDVAGTQSALYLDDITLQGSAQSSSDLLIEHDVVVGSMTSDRFTWKDSAAKTRSAVLAHNTGQIGPQASGGYVNRGGALRQFTYVMPNDTTRTAGVTTYGNAGQGGFGYVVSHRGDGSAGIGDDSPLGYTFAGTFTRAFEGKHHAIFRFTQNYPRHSSDTANPPRTKYDVPVTIEWLFATGKDHPLWAVSYDMSAVPADHLRDDSRAPYGELNIDGTGAANIDGTAWGDRYKFSSTTAPVTLNSAWTWNVPNVVPYVKLWIASTDATMGIVQSQSMTRQDAGGGRNPFYHDLTGHWGKTSADGNAGGAYRMPYQDAWPYQANSFSITTAAASNNARLTWGTQYGFLGQQSYTVNDGVVANASGYPRKSYSTFIVLGPHSTGPVESQVDDVIALESVTLSASIGTVRSSGPAGAGRADTVTFTPPGYNHVYGALAFNASTNRLDANIAVGSGTLEKPVLILSGYTLAAPPAVVRLAGLTATADVDYFASVRPGASELWLTLNRDLTGATNRVEVLQSAAPTIQASGPTTFCQGGSVTLTASTPEGAGITYLWTPGNATTRAIVATQSGSYSVTVTTSGTPATSDPTVVTVVPVPATPVIVVPAIVRPGASVTASATQHAGSTYAWTITNGTITAGQGSNQITFTAGTPGTAVVKVVESASGCASAEASATVRIFLKGDFNADGKTDIVLRNYSTGQNALWLMNGTSLSAITDLPALPNTAYRFEGTADFNADGKNDMVLRNYTTGQNALWLMNGVSLTQIVDLPALSNVNYHIEGTGDFNGDGKPDIMLRNYASGQNAVWLMNGTSLLSVNDLPALPNTNYRLESSGDFNGDGKSDIVLRNYATGQNAVWLMNGVTLQSILDLPALPNLSYRFDGVGDFNSDGKADIVLRNYATGQNAVWLMNGTTLTSIKDLPALSNVAYEINGPR